MDGVNDYTKGNIRKPILGFFFPMLMTNMLQQLYSFVDTAIVGKGLGDNALASVGNMSSLSFLVIGFSIGLANGFSVLIAQSFGEKNFDKLRHNLAAAIKLAVIITVVLTVSSLMLLKNALAWMNTDKQLLKDSLLYGYIIFGGLVASIAYNMSAGVLRAFGDSKTPLKAIIASSVLNIVLDIFFIFVLKTGVEGAAIATVFSQIISASICIIKIRTIEFAKLSKEDYSNSFSVYYTLLKNGIPMAFMNSITAIGCMVVQSNVNSLGVDYTAAYSACSKYLNLFMQPACTAGYTMSAFTGQNSGAGRFDRVKSGLNVCLSIAFISYILLGSCMVFGSRFLAGIFLTGERPIQLAAMFLPICGFAIVAVDCLFVIRSGVQGMGYPFIPMLSGIVEMVIRVAVIVLLVGRIGFVATAIAEVGAWTGALVLNSVAFVRILSSKLKEKRYITGYECRKRSILGKRVI